jgi:hypothetical protein
LIRDHAISRWRRVGSVADGDLAPAREEGAVAKSPHRANSRILVLVERLAFKKITLGGRRLVLGWNALPPAASPT